MPRMASDIPLYTKQRAPKYLMGKKDTSMPLVKGEKAKSEAGFSQNVKAEMHAGKPQKQAVAIAYSEARHSKKKQSHGSNQRHKEGR